MNSLIRSREHSVSKGLRLGNLFLLLVLGVTTACTSSKETTITTNRSDMTIPLKHWNQIAIDASGLDHMPANQGPPHVFGQQVGPCRASRAEAIVHVAVFEAMNAIEGGYESSLGLQPAQPGTSMEAAISKAAHDTLASLFPSQSAIFDKAMDDELAQIPSGAPKDQGMAVGQAAASAILQRRANDGSQLPEPKIGIDYIPSNLPGKWRQDPVSKHPLALGANWNQVTPFAMTSANQFRIIPPPALDSAEYAAAFNEAKTLGGDGHTTSTTRTPEQTLISTFWAYDGTPSLCAPPRLYNQITVQLATQKGLSAMEMARLLALVNVAMSDAGIAVWESKYYYAFWRPIGGIRESGAGTGPSGIGDGNSAITGDVAFMPLGAPASNGTGPNFTPPFPAYPSGHAGFGGALFQTLRRFFGTDKITFTFVSDEYNGVTKDNSGAVRPLTPRTFTSLSQAEEENGQSRIYLGIHWKFDKDKGIQQGQAVGNYVFDRMFLPKR